MKIGVYEVNSTEHSDSNVNSVYVQQEGEDCSVIINTRDRWIDYSYVGGSTNPEAKALLERSAHSISFILDSGCFDDGEPVANSHHTEVIIFAETEAEAHLLHGVKYALQNKDQIEYLIKPLAIKNKLPLAFYVAEESRRSAPSM